MAPRLLAAPQRAHGLRDALAGDHGATERRIRRALRLQAGRLQATRLGAGPSLRGLARRAAAPRLILLSRRRGLLSSGASFCVGAGRDGESPHLCDSTSTCLLRIGAYPRDNQRNDGLRRRGGDRCGPHMRVRRTVRRRPARARPGPFAHPVGGSRLSRGAA
jgi:hypothetical protein